jgi:hypothetical protein
MPNLPLLSVSDFLLIVLWLQQEAYPGVRRMTDGHALCVIPGAPPGTPADPLLALPVAADLQAGVLDFA